MLSPNKYFLIKSNRDQAPNWMVPSAYGHKPSERKVYVVDMVPKHVDLNWEWGFHWELIPAENAAGYFRIVNRVSGLSLVAGKNNNGIWQYPYSDYERNRLTDKRFHWKFEPFIPSAMGYYRIDSRHDGRSIWTNNNELGLYSFKNAKKENKENNSFMYRVEAIELTGNAGTIPKNEVVACTSCHRLVPVDISPESNYCSITKGQHTIDPKQGEKLVLSEFGYSRKESRGPLENYDQLSDCINCGTIFRMTGGGINNDKNFHFTPPTTGWCHAQPFGHVASKRRYLVKPMPPHSAPVAGTKSVAKCIKCSSILDKGGTYPGCKDDGQIDWVANGQPTQHVFEVYYNLAIKPTSTWDKVFDPGIRKPFPAFSSGKQGEIYQYIRNALSNNIDPRDNLRNVWVNKRNLGVIHGDFLNIQMPSQFAGFASDWKTVYDQIHEEMDLADRIHQHFLTVEDMITDAFLEMTWATSENILRIDAENKNEIIEVDPLSALLSILGKSTGAMGELPEIGTAFKGVSKGVEVITLLIDTIKKHAAGEQAWQAQDKIKIERAELWKELGSYFNNVKGQLSKQKQAILSDWGMLEATKQLALDLKDETVVAIKNAMVSSFSLHTFQIMFASRFVLIDAIQKPGVNPNYINWLRDNKDKDHPALHIIERDGYNRNLHAAASNTIWKFVVKKESINRLSYYLTWMSGELDISFFPSENLMQEIYRRPPLKQQPDHPAMAIGKANLFDSDAIFYGVGGWDALPVRKMWMEPNNWDENDLSINFKPR